MSEIITHTPVWVFILLGALLVLGYSQTKDREVKLSRLFILPISMILLSIFGVVSAFGIMPESLIMWLIGGSISLLIGLKLSLLQNIQYNNEKKVFCILGSWVPMFLILIIFFLKYFIGVVIAKQLAIIDQIEFILIIGFLYGFISGIFLSRSIVIFKSKNT